MTKGLMLDTGGSWAGISAVLRLALPLAGLLLMHNTAGADDTAAGSEKQYFNLASQYDSLSFSLGPLQTFESPDSERYRDLTVPMHDGKVRLGVLDKYATVGPVRQDNMQAQAQGQAKRMVHKRLAAEREVYLGLLALQFGADYFTPENLLQDNPGGRGGRFMTMGTLAPRGYVGSLAFNVYQEAYFKTAFCREAPSCWDPQYRAPAPMNSNMARRWGGGSDEFAGRTAVEAFIANDLQPLLGWSRALSPEVALVGVWSLPEYDFSRGGFAFEVHMPRAGSSGSSIFGYNYFESADAAVKVVGSIPTMSKAFLPMAAGPAEALIEAMKAAPDNGAGYYALAGRVINVAMKEPAYGGGKFTLLYELTSADVTFYKDKALTQPLGTVKLQVPQ